MIQSQIKIADYVIEVLQSLIYESEVYDTIVDLNEKYCVGYCEDEDEKESVLIIYNTLTDGIRLTFSDEFLKFTNIFGLEKDDYFNASLTNDFYFCYDELKRVVQKFYDIRRFVRVRIPYELYQQIINT